MFLRVQSLRDFFQTKGRAFSYVPVLLGCRFSAFSGRVVVAVVVLCGKGALAAKS